MKTMPLLFAALTMAAPLGYAAAQQIGSTRDGESLARSICAECHQVGRGAAAAARNQAPNFETLANMRGVNAMALRVALQTSHTKMPNLMLSEDQRESVIAYILTLKNGSSR